eukprot:scaffold195402_cov31-Prasinocladus_malaysianus.AAC.1
MDSMPMRRENVEVAALHRNLSPQCSSLYLLVTAHDLAEITAHWQSVLHDTDDGRHMTVQEIREKDVLRQEKWRIVEWIASAMYSIGCSTFIIGSACFLPSIYETYPLAGPWMLVCGSSLFMTASIINMLQLYTLTSSFTIQLLNATDVQFLLGSVLFLIGSITYLLDWGPAPAAWTMASTLGASLFIAGSRLAAGLSLLGLVVPRPGQRVRG